MSFAASVLKRSSRSFWSTPPKFSEVKASEGKAIRLKDLVKTVAETHDLSQAESKRILDTIFDTISENLANKVPVTITNFGKFESVTSKARTARNPTTQEPIQVPEKQRVKFAALTNLKAAVNKKE